MLGLLRIGVFTLSFFGIIKEYDLTVYEKGSGFNLNIFNIRIITYFHRNSSTNSYSDLFQSIIFRYLKFGMVK